MRVSKACKSVNVEVMKFGRKSVFIIFVVVVVVRKCYYSRFSKINGQTWKILIFWNITFSLKYGSFSEVYEKGKGPNFT